jgi:sugar lactone lactonase YvrE
MSDDYSEVVVYDADGKLQTVIIVPHNPTIH